MTHEYEITPQGDITLISKSYLMKNEKEYKIYVFFKCLFKIMIKIIKILRTIY